MACQASPAATVYCFPCCCIRTSGGGTEWFREFAPSGSAVALVQLSLRVHRHLPGRLPGVRSDSVSRTENGSRRFRGRGDPGAREPRTPLRTQILATVAITGLVSGVIVGGRAGWGPAGRGGDRFPRDCRRAARDSGFPRRRRSSAPRSSPVTLTATIAKDSLPRRPTGAGGLRRDPDPPHARHPARTPRPVRGSGPPTRPGPGSRGAGRGMSRGGCPPVELRGGQPPLLLVRAGRCHIERRLVRRRRTKPEIRRIAPSAAGHSWVPVSARLL